MQETDQDLIEQYRGGDLDALDALVARHRRTLFGYIVNTTAGRDDPDDVFQEVWIRAIKKLDRYQHGNLCGWLVRIAHNVIIDRARRRKPDVSLDQQTEAGGSLMDTLVDTGPEADDNMANRELGVRMAEAVETLPDDQRQVFLMRVRANLPFKEIADIQGVSINTALARMQYALAKMRPLLQDEYDMLQRT